MDKVGFLIFLIVLLLGGMIMLSSAETKRTYQEPEPINYEETIVNESVFSFNGDNFMLCNISNIGDNNFSINMWFRTNVTNVHQDILFKGYTNWRWISYTVRSSNDNSSLWIQIDDSNLTTEIRGKSKVADGEWHNGLVEFERTRYSWIVKLYIDGSLEAQREIHYGVFDTHLPLKIGGFYNYGNLNYHPNNYDFQGEVKYLRIDNWSIEECKQ